jgi:hypothetical protein
MNMKHFLRTVIAILSVAVAAPASAQNCNDDRWYPLVPTSPIGSADGRLSALLTVGPPGAQITYAGGSFTQIGGVAANRIAAWDGTAWHAMGAGFDDGEVYAIAECDDGTGKAIYAAGWLRTSAGITVNNIAKWNGTAWQPVGAGVGDQDTAIAALQVFDDGTGSALYATGNFLLAGGQPASRIARWDGGHWSPLGVGINNTGYAMAVFDDGKGPSLFVGGVFSSAGGLWNSRIARWNGTNWAAVGSVASGFGVSLDVFALAVHDDGSGPALFVGGRFLSAGYVVGSGCARWDGFSWRSVGLPTPISQFSVNSLVSVDTGAGRTLCAGGAFRATSSDGRLIQGIAQWDGTKWAPMGSGVTYNSNSVYWGSGVTCMTSQTPASEQPLIVGGSFGTAGGGAATNIATWSFPNAAWLVGGRPLASVLAVTEDPEAPDGAVIVGGAFTTIGSETVNRVARWDGAAWAGMGAGFNGRVQALHRATFGGVPSVFAGGAFTKSGNDPIGGIGRWDGSAWRPLGPGVNGTVLAIESNGQTEAGLIAAGQFTTAGGQPARNIARWDGSAWQPLGTGLDGTVYALAYFGQGTARALYAGGAFTTAGGVPARGIARWDGSTWSAVGPGISGSIATVYALRDVSTADDPRLAVGGSFTRAAELDAANIATWNGTEWLALGTGLNGPVFALESQPLRSTRTIYAGGAFTNTASGDVALSRFARFDDGVWKAPGSVGDAVQALLLARVGGATSLFVGGSFQSSPSSDPFFTSWRRCAACDTDLNGDSTVDGADLGLLLGSWGACENCAADVNNDAVVDGADLGRVLGDWGPCPD